ncbi:MAG: PASTA domain-containing protein, partial [Chloroflexota bacterium]|nr:PASTA domain-containing protein [Chloroflexota bacterium]
PTPEPVTVGNYSLCGPVSEQRALIEEAGLEVGEVWPPEHAEDGFVANQYPLPGTQVAPGTPVLLMVRGPLENCP